jgi:hypothetical protein
VELIGGILKADPGNPEALELRDAVRQDVEEQLDKLLQDPAFTGARDLRERAESLARLVLSIDPDNDRARSLLHRIVHRKAAFFRKPAKTTAMNRIIEVALRSSRKSGIQSPIAAGLVVLVLAVGVILLVAGGPEESVETGPRQAEGWTSAETAGPYVSPVVLNAGSPLPDSDKTAAFGDGKTVDPDAADGIPASRGIEYIYPGTLAVSSDVTAEVYDGDTLIGTTPITLRLSPGTHTFEYRYLNVVRTLSHAITSNETTTASVVFNATLRINARPWAEVFVEGDPVRLLGQTPLSNASVPVGSVLIFRNPNFQEKRRRVTAAAEDIQVEFP